MKTKFVLHGGLNPERLEENNAAFYREILADTPKELSILIAPFAKDIERIPVTTERVMSMFNKNKGDKNLNFQIANEESFIKQIESADIVFFQGGKSSKLLETIKEYPNLEESLKGKIIAGESAGANVLGKFFYSPNADQISEGLGILPIKIIPHFKKEYENKLDKINVNLELVSLQEYEYKIFYK